MLRHIAFSFALAAAALLVIPAGAGAGKPLDEIERLARQVRAGADNPRLSRRDREKVRWHLSRALAILEGRDDSAEPNEDYDGCVAFAFEGYSRSHAPGVARRRAKERCKGSRLLGVARLLFDAYSKSYAPATAMDLALDRAENRELRGKRALLEYAIAGYSRSYAASTAVERAVEEVAQLRVAGLRCLRRADRSHRREVPAFTALDRAFAECRQRFGEK